MTRNPAALQPVLVAITGGIACGKSSVGRILARHGVDIWDADEAAHALSGPGSPIVEALIREFGAEIYDAEGHLDRSKFSRIVFESNGARRKANAIFHPPIIAECEAWRRRIRREGRSAAALIPLLFETGLDSRTDWDVIVCVTDHKDRILRRLAERGLSPTEAEQRIAAQWPLAEKEKRADVVLHNDADLHILERETLKVWRQIIQQGRMHHERG